MKYAFDAGAVVGNTLYVSDNYCNALLSFDLLSGESKYIGEFKGESATKQLMHKCCVKNDNRLYFVPNASDYLHIFNCNSGEFKAVKIHRSSDTRFVFGGAFIYGDCLWIMPGNKEQPVIKYGLKEKEFFILGSFENWIGDLKQPHNQCFWKMCCLDGDVYLAVLGTSKILCYELGTGKTRLIDTNIDNLDSIYITTSAIFLCTGDMRVYKWNPRDNETHECYLRGVEKKNSAFVVVETGVGEVVLIPNYGGQALRYDGENAFEIDEKLILDGRTINERAVHYENWDLWGNNSVLFPSHGDGIFCIDSGGIKRINNVDITSVEYIEKRYKAFGEKLTNNLLIKEGIQCSLDDFVGAIAIS